MVSDATTPLPAELAQLFADGGAGRTLPVALPAGRLVRPRSPGGDPPAYWLSDQPAPATLWSRLRAAHSRSGLWPLLLEGLDSESARPWEVGEVHPQPVGQIDHHDAARFLASVWSGWVRFVEEDYEPDFVVEALAPFGRDWPGLAAPGAPVGDPDVVADQCAACLEDGQARLGLVAADRGADTLALSGWTGPGNHAETAPLAAVVRSWEDRFGVRVVRVGFATLYLSVAAPPVTAEHTLQVAAEHWAFCPDNIEQGLADTLADYARQIRGKNLWSFWWD